jgi:general secretion pathway protein D
MDGAAQLARWIGVAVLASLLGCRSDPARGEPSPAARATAAPISTSSASQETPAPAAPEQGGSPAPSSRATSTPVSPGSARFAFDFEGIDLPELVRLVGAITGKRFVYSGKMPTVHASAHSPDRLTAEEVYQAFLEILRMHGLTVVERGRLHVILPSPEGARQGPIL